jgi:S1-C subfamily serine protease
VLLLVALLLTTAAAPEGAAGATPALRPDDPGIAHEGGPPSAMVFVRGGAWVGSAVVWNAAARQVLTALHVVEGMPPEAIEVVLPGRGAVPARVVDREPALDLAVLEVAAELHAAPPLGDARALPGGAAIELAACGTSHCSPVPGRVLASSRTFAGARYLAVAARVQPGSSGAAVLDESGALVGIVDLALTREPGTALAVPVDRAVARFPRD